MRDACDAERRLQWATTGVGGALGVAREQRIEWLASDYLALEKLANELHETPEEIMVMLEKTYQAELQFNPRDYS